MYISTFLRVLCVSKLLKTTFGVLVWTRRTKLTDDNVVLFPPTMYNGVCLFFKKTAAQTCFWQLFCTALWSQVQLPLSFIFNASPVWRNGSNLQMPGQRWIGPLRPFPDSINAFLRWTSNNKPGLFGQKTPTLSWTGLTKSESLKRLSWLSSPVPYQLHLWLHLVTAS